MQERDPYEGIRQLVGLLPSRFGSLVEAACSYSLHTQPPPERSAIMVNAISHSYGPNDTRICDGRHGSLVFEEMCLDGRCSAPTFSSDAIYTGKIEDLLPFHDLIVKIVDKAEWTVYNVTLPKHILFPGFVKLTVEERSAETVVAVSGKGIGNWGWANSSFAPFLFETILEEHLVRSVKRRLALISSFAGGGGSFGGGGSRGNW